MKTFSKNDKIIFQGDLALIRVDALPDEDLKVNETGVVAHSETGHNHTLDDTAVATLYEVESDPLAAYIKADGPVNLVHHRSFDPHETINLDDGIYKVRRQREHTPEGLRRVAD